MFFRYDPTRKGEVALSLLQGFEGVVQTDAYAGYNKIYTPDTCARIACLAHVRRKFVDVQETANKEVQKILFYIASLYRLDIKVRAVKGVVILEQLFQYLESVKLQTLPRAPLIDALNYALTQKDEIFRIISDDLFDLDNNAIERQMKKIAVGRKNYLFAGSHEGAHAAAVVKVHRKTNILCRAITYYSRGIKKENRDGKRTEKEELLYLGAEGIDIEEAPCREGRSLIDLRRAAATPDSILRMAT